MNAVITTPAEFAEALTAKFAGDPNLTYANRVFSVDSRGQKYARIVQRDDQGNGGSVHCFVEKSTGHVLKAASWSTPAKGVRFMTMDDALAAADVFGGYLYARRA